MDLPITDSEIKEYLLECFRIVLLNDGDQISDELHSYSVTVTGYGADILVYWNFDNELEKEFQVYNWDEIWNFLSGESAERRAFMLGVKAIFGGTEFSRTYDSAAFVRVLV